MGDFSLTCSISGLGISGGDPVRCILVTATPYEDDDPRHAWIVRTPPIRAVYNSYGSIEDVNKDDLFAANLWLRGLREDLVEKGLGDNSVHDVATAKNMTFENLLDALVERRIEVRQDTKHFWRRPLIRDPRFDPSDLQSPFYQRVEKVLSKAVDVSRSAAPDKYTVDEPVPYLARVRYGQYTHGAEQKKALEIAQKIIEQAGFVGVVTAGSGRYADSADLIVMPAPSAKDEHVTGPQWDMAKGQSASGDKTLTVELAMVREDVWQALISYPHETTVTADCITCGQQFCYHEKGRLCPNKSVNNKPFKKHKKGSKYEHGPVFPDGVECKIVSGDYSERVWFGLSAYKAGVHTTWKEIQDNFEVRNTRTSKPAKPAKKLSKADEDLLDKMMAGFRVKQKEEKKRIAALPEEERQAIEAEGKARLEELEKQEQDKIDNPVFGDFLISDALFSYERQIQGSWIFRRSVPGVLGIPEHLSMCMADKVEVPLSVLDSLAELAAFEESMRAVGVTWKPARSTGPQYPEWKEHARFANTLAQIAHKLGEKEDDKEYVALPTTIAEALS